MEQPSSSYGSTYENAPGAEDFRMPIYPLSGTQVRLEKLMRVLVLCALFLGSWRVARWGWTNFTLSDVCLVVAGAILLVQGRANGRPFGELSSIWYFGFAAMLGGLLVGTMLNGDPQRWFIASSQYLFAYVFLPIILMSLDRQLLMRGMLLFVYGVALSQVIGIVTAQFFDYTATFYTLDHGFITPNGRIGAMTGEPNWNGAMCAFALAMLAYLHLRGQIRVLIAIACAICICAGLVVSASFTAIASAAGGLMIMILASGGGRAIKIGLAFVLVITSYVVLGGPLPEAFGARVSGALVTGDLSQAGTFDGRTLLIYEAWDMLDKTMFIGLGVDGYREASSYGVPVHNLYLIIGNEGGLIALFGLVCMIMVALTYSINFYRKDRLDGAVCLTMLGIFIAYSLAIPHMYTRIWVIPLFLCLAMSRQSWMQQPQYIPRGQ
ncbi:O-antigen ligase family protein [Aurantiacibacter atlanticus]|nr:hypothetical protein [Aurantiacibacter atlanticus]